MRRTRRASTSSCRATPSLPFPGLPCSSLTFARLRSPSLHAFCRYVFQQGDEGDAFYVITEGQAPRAAPPGAFGAPRTAEIAARRAWVRQVITEGQAVILRDEEDVSEPIVLAEVGEGAYFGERALLKNTVRFAPAKAASPSVALYHLLCPSLPFHRLLVALLAGALRLGQGGLEEALHDVRPQSSHAPSPQIPGHSSVPGAPLRARGTARVLTRMLAQERHA